MAKCLEMLCTTNGQHLAIWNPLDLCYISHISGGEYPPNVPVLENTECEACWCWHGGTPRAEAAHVRTGTIVPLPTTQKLFPGSLGQEGGGVGSLADPAER